MARKPGSWQSERCLVCAHPRLAHANYSLARGVPPLAVARELGLNPGSVYNHSRKHISETYRKIIGSGVYRDIDELLKACTKGDAESLDILNAAISGTFHQWSLAFANGAQSGMTAHGSQLRQFLELRAKITRELLPAQHLSMTTNFLISDASQLLQILKPYPEARAAIAAYYADKVSPKVIEHVAAD